MAVKRGSSISAGSSSSQRRRPALSTASLLLALCLAAAAAGRAAAQTCPPPSDDGAYPFPFVTSNFCNSVGINVPNNGFACAFWGLFLGLLTGSDNNQLFCNNDARQPQSTDAKGARGECMHARACMSPGSLVRRRPASAPHVRATCCPAMPRRARLLPSGYAVPQALPDRRQDGCRTPCSPPRAPRTIGFTATRCALPAGQPAARSATPRPGRRRPAGSAWRRCGCHRASQSTSSMPPACRARWCSSSAAATRRGAAAAARLLATLRRPGASPRSRRSCARAPRCW